jgi:hypothetical protein
VKHLGPMVPSQLGLVPVVRHASMATIHITRPRTGNKRSPRDVVPNRELLAWFGIVLTLKSCLTLHGLV